MEIVRISYFITGIFKTMGIFNKIIIFIFNYSNKKYNLDP